MSKIDLNYDNYPKDIKEEKMPKTEKNELLAIAYASAKAREVLGTIPEKAIVEVSGEIIENVQSIVVPNLSNLKGIEAAIAAGIMDETSEKKLEEISDIAEVDNEEIKKYIEASQIEVKKAETPFIFDIQVNLFYKDSCVKIRTVNDSTNIILIEKDGNILYIKEADNNEIINVENTCDYEDEVDIEDIKEVMGRKN